MATYFPANPTINDVYQPEGSTTQYIWTGTYWAVQNNTRPLFDGSQSGSIVTVDAEGYAKPGAALFTNGVLQGTASIATSASFARSSSFTTTASFAQTASTVNTLNQPVIISGSFTVHTGSATEFSVTNVGVTLGNALTDRHNVTGSLSVSGSLTGSLFGTASFAATASFVAKRWITLGRSSNLTGYGLNSEIVWNTVVSSSNANITVSSQNITLPAGTYQVMGTIGTNDYSSTEGYINVALQNSSNVTLPGVNIPNPGPMSGTYNFGAIPTMLGIIQLTTQTVVKLRVTAAAGTCTVNTDTRLSLIEI